jgi:hypothetical protein
MAVEGQKKRKYDRIYMGYNPIRAKGPAVNILDTVVKPIPKPEENP